MLKIVFIVFFTLVLSVIFTSATPLNKRQIQRYKNNNKNFPNRNRIQKNHRNPNKNNILRKKRLEAKKARLDLIDEMLKFYWDTLKVFVSSHFATFNSSLFLDPCILLTISIPRS